MPFQHAMEHELPVLYDDFDLDEEGRVTPMSTGRNCKTGSSASSTGIGMCAATNADLPRALPCGGVPHAPVPRTTLPSEPLEQRSLPSPEGHVWAVPRRAGHISRSYLLPLALGAGP